MESGGDCLNSPGQFFGNRPQTGLQSRRCHINSAVNAGQCAAEGGFDGGRRPFSAFLETLKESLLQMTGLSGRGGSI